MRVRRADYIEDTLARLLDTYERQYPGVGKQLVISPDVDVPNLANNTAISRTWVSGLLVQHCKPLVPALVSLDSGNSVQEERFHPKKKR